MRRIAIGLVGWSILVASATPGTVEAERRPSGAESTTLLVPAYFYPGGDGLAGWKRLEQAARSVRLEVIVNPASGPGERRDPNYTKVIGALHGSGAGVLAYVDTDYGRRSLAAVEKDLKTYAKFYKVDGIFLDQMASTPDALAHYRAIRRLIAQVNPDYRVVGNPGIPHIASEYLETADTLVTFEGSGRSFAAYDPHTDGPWMSRHAPRRFATIVHGVDTAEGAREVLARSRATGLGRRVHHRRADAQPLSRAAILLVGRGVGVRRRPRAAARTRNPLACSTTRPWQPSHSFDARTNHRALHSGNIWCQHFRSYGPRQAQ